jgi:hypothetical protein
MASRWVKAVFLVIIGIVILYYSDGLVNDLKHVVEQHSSLNLTYTWSLLTILLWILVAWLFIDAALTVALSFSEHRYSLLDVMTRLQKIERRIGVPEPGTAGRQERSEADVEEVVEEPAENEVPPPPSE